MSWFRSPGFTEYILGFSFLILYSIYLFRTFKAGRLLVLSKVNFWFKTTLRLLVLSLILISILGPSFGETRREVKSVGKDILICVDLSRSMDATDIVPSRLEKVKFEMKRIVDAFSSDRVGVIIFSSEAFMQCPMTFDQNALHLFIETMTTGLVPSAGTDFGPPLEMAIEKFKSDESNRKENSRILILISDGEDFGEKTESIARKLEDEGITMFTLGVGTESGSPIPTPRGYKTDRSGNMVTTRLDREPLELLAELSSGSYYEISDSRNDVPKMIRKIGSIEGLMRDSRMIDISANRYFYFLIFAFLLFCIDVLMPVKSLRI
ncbi:MAG: vWA domain-containing protein [Cyclobacteriaceae bacterium]